MNGLVRDPQLWTARRLWTVAALAVLGQVALIHWASDRTPFHPRILSGRPPVELAAGPQNELLALTDPTLFARANPNGFSGPAWMVIPGVDFAADHTNNILRWLALAPQQLGAHFREFVQTNQLSLVAAGPAAQPAPTLPHRAAGLALAAQSLVRVEGALAGRTPFHLPTPPAQTNSDVLRPSEVELQVDARGNPVSVRIAKSSGLKLADQLAVALARNAQFSPDQAALKQSPADPDAGLVSGRMIFIWHTVPAAVPASPGSNPR